MADLKYDIGIIGIGTMGRNLALNLNDHGYAVAGLDKDEKQIALFQEVASNRNIFATVDLQNFIRSLKTPRGIILLVPAGRIVDNVIDEVTPFLESEDVLMDWGNSHFIDTNVRIERLAKSSIHFMGVGISGGETGARFGPSIMPGGPKVVYDRIADMLTSIAAHIGAEPCATWLGPGSAGHYVKMVHNGIEYGLMQLIAESYHLLKELGKQNNSQIQEIMMEWNNGRLHSFLVEITSIIFKQQDEYSSHLLIDMILDSAHQKGTGGWTSQDAMNLQVPIPVIDVAVSMRDMSAYKKEREKAQQKLSGPNETYHGEQKELFRLLEESLYFSMITTYAQGFSLLHYASTAYQYDLRLEDIARIWRGGCIIRSSLLEPIYKAFAQQPELSSLMLDDYLGKELVQSQESIRQLIQLGVASGIPIPAFMGSLAYFDSYRSDWLPANLIQAQRDFFGAHTYERKDKEGVFHTSWNLNQV